MKKIKRYLKKVFENKIVALGVIPFCLILFWFVASIFFNNKISFSVLIYKHPHAINASETKHKLTKGMYVRGTFTAKDNYLGIIFVNFEHFIKPDYRGEDVLSFRIKEKGAKDWYYFNNYRSGLLENKLQFPFGFPVVGWSKGKTYEFEIKSLLGNDTNAVSIGSSDIFSASQMPKAEIIGSKKRVVIFLIKKITTSFTNKEFIFSSFLYLLPLLIYVAWQIFLKKIKSNKLFFIFMFCLIFTDILLLKEFYLGVYLALLVGWIFSSIINKFKSKTPFVISFVFILFWIIALCLNINGDYSKINIWVYTFFVMGTVQAIIEETKNTKHK